MINKLNKFFFSIVLITLPLCATFSRKRPALKEVGRTKRMTDKELSEISKQMEEKDSRIQQLEKEKNDLLQANKNSRPVNQETFRLSSQEESIARLIRGALQLETEVGDRHIANPEYIRLDRVIQNDGNSNAYSTYRISSKAKALSWEALGTGKIAYFFVRRWPWNWIHDLEETNNITIIWKKFQKEQYEIRISAQGSSDSVNTKIYPIHHKFTDFLCRTPNQKLKTNRLEMIVKGDDPCCSSNYTKHVIIQCPRYILMHLIAEEQNRLKNV
jgi:hypothetical protein